jgi:mRNA-degrading endonuclease RelE of RelBE toxin-antitoxin system
MYLCNQYHIDISASTIKDWEKLGQYIQKYWQKQYYENNYRPYSVPCGHDSKYKKIAMDIMLQYQKQIIMTFWIHQCYV